jgi:hypothetical protein
MSDTKNAANGSDDFPEGGRQDPAGQQLPAMATGDADNIRDEQQTHFGGAVPPAYVGSGDPENEHKPEEAADDSGNWDEQGR